MQLKSQSQFTNPVLESGTNNDLKLKSIFLVHHINVMELFALSFGISRFGNILKTFIQTLMKP